MNVYPKIIEIPQDLGYIPRLGEILTPGMLFTSTQAFYRFMRPSKATMDSSERYLYSLQELGIMEKSKICPPLMYLGVVGKSFYLDHKFLLGTKFCFMYDDDFAACLPLTLTIFNSNS